MDKEVKETVLQAVEYTNTEAEAFNKRVRMCNAFAMILIFGHTVIRESDIYNANSVVMAATDFAQGAAVGLLLMGTIMLSRYGNKIRKFKQRLLKKGVE